MGITRFIRELKRLTIRDQMQKPYTRIVLMHLTIIFGGFLVMLLDARTPALLLLIAMEILVDLRSHTGEHKSAAGKSPGS